VETKHRCKTVVILAFFFPPDNSAGAARPFRFFKYLPRFGYETRVVTVAPQDRVRSREAVRYVPHPRDRGPLPRLAERVLRKFVAPDDDGIAWFPYAAAAARRWVEHDGASVVLSTSPAISTHLAAMRLKRRYGVKWIADFRDPIVGSPFRTGSRRFDAFLEPRIFQQADAVIANTDALEQTWLDRYPQHRRKISVLWNGFDPEEAIAAMAIPERNHRVLTHTGDIYGPRHPGQLFAAMTRLLDRGALEPGTLKIRLVGQFVPDWLPEHAAAMQALVKSGQVDCSGEVVPRAQAIEALAESDYLLLLDVSGPQAGIQVPSKTFEYLQIGRPVLTFTTRNSALARILERSGVPGVCIYDTDGAGTVDERMMEFLRLPRNPVRASDWFWEQFDGVNQARQLAAWIDELTGK
jgi:glycosyltransferase involved in cell wall biosynthesis